MSSNSSASASKRYLSSEAYRAMLVKDGERRFQEWHNAFLAYQKSFQQEMAASRRQS